MRTICYVILNYKTYEEAAACAESILSTQTWKNMHIVIVDNGSGNGSEEWLFFLFFFDPPADNSMTAFLGYYGFVIANLCNATRLANAFDKKRKDNGNTIAANRNGISERSD